MKNFVQPGRVITVTAPSGGAVSGAPLLVGSLFGVAAFSAAAGAAVEIETEGVYDLPKTAGDVFAAGGKVYFVAATGAVTATAASNSWIGVATAAATGSAATARVRLNQHPI